MNNIDATLYEA